MMDRNTNDLAENGTDLNAGKSGWKSIYIKVKGSLAAGLLLSACVCQAQNLAQNPGFESGSTSGWFAFGSPTMSAQTGQVHSGGYAALIQNRTATWNGIAQSMQSIMQPGQTYNISGWVRIASGSGQTVQLTIQKSDGSGTGYTAVGSGAASTSGWTQLSGQYTLNVSGTLNSLTLYFEVPSSSNADFYMDDLTVESVSSGTSGEDGATMIFWNDVYQRIDGFGASSAWRSTWTSAQANFLFSTNSGISVARNGSPFAYTGVGLSLLRTRIAPGGTTVEQNIMQMAQARGARVWSAPWSPAPAAQFKSNGSVNGGSFIGNVSNYQAYASQLAGYVVRMKNQYGVNLYALSVQNEPDANVTTYESCKWTAQQIHDFIPYLASALAASNVATTKIMLPESQNWTDPQGLALATMNDPSAASLVGIIANHNYVANNAVGDQSPPGAVASYGKALWETEVAKLSGNDSSISDGLYWAGRVHQFLTIAQANAWHYWWLFAYGTANEGLCDTNDVPAKRMYTVGNFSRFVRPGFYRIGVTNSGTSLVSAFKNSTNGGFAVVAINPAASAMTQTFNLNGFAATSVTPWITSASLSLAAQSSVTVSNSTFAYTLPAMSIVTFVGQALVNTQPLLAPVSNQTVNVGVPVTITNAVTDAESPPQILTFSLLSSEPANASLNSSNGVFTWRPLVGQADTTNLIIVRVVDDGTPPLADTNSYTLTVNPLAQPSLDAVSITEGQVNLTVSGPFGPDYTLWSSTNLFDWQALFTTNSPPTPVTLVDTNLNEPARFYRIELGP